MLTRAGLGDDSRLADSSCEEDLADSVVDLVRTSMIPSTGGWSMT